MTSIIEAIKNMFNDNVGDLVISFLSHPTADLMKAHFRHKELCSFDNMHDWTTYNGLGGWTTNTNWNEKVRRYKTWNKGPAHGGLVRLKIRGWYVWHRDWSYGFRVKYLKVPDGIDVVYHCNDEGVKRVKLVTGDYKPGPNEDLWDDVLEYDDDEDNGEEPELRESLSSSSYESSTQEEDETEEEED